MWPTGHVAAPGGVTRGVCSRELELPLRYREPYPYVPRVPSSRVHGRVRSFGRFNRMIRVYITTHDPPNDPRVDRCSVVVKI